MNLLQKKYLKTALNPQDEEKDYKEANIFLAEDRILCLGKKTYLILLLVLFLLFIFYSHYTHNLYFIYIGIFTQPKEHFILKYIPIAEAYCDPAETFEDLLR